ncbi:MAG: UPF0175 family protein [Thermomicrobiales bacterium]
MSRISLELDDDVAALLRQDNQPLDQTAREVIIMDLYRRAIISGGRAAELLGMDKRTFIRRADDRGIPYFQLTKEDLEAEFRASQEL